MRKYRIIRETNLNTAEEIFIIQSRRFIFFWKDKVRSKYFHPLYNQLLQLNNPDKFKREEVAIDNIYI